MNYNDLTPEPLPDAFSAYKFEHKGKTQLNFEEFQNKLILELTGVAKEATESPNKRSRGGEGGAAAGGKKAKVLLAVGVDQHGVPLLHEIQNLTTLKGSLSSNNRKVTCKMCGSAGACAHCATCTERHGVPFGICGLGTGRLCIGRHFQESGK